MNPVKNMPPVIMLTGKNGQVGWELNRSLMPLGRVVALDRTQCDLSKPETLPAIVQEIKPDIIVNAAAYTTVDKAEEEEALATTINATSVGVLAEEAKKHNALFVHYSTDYVFDGTKQTPYTEEDTPNPLNAYGRSKLAGEEAVRQSGVEHLIFRTSWVFASRGNNFAKTMLRLAQERDELKVVADQFGAPTSAELIADITAFVLHYLKMELNQSNHRYGTYHLTAAGKISWHGYAGRILESAHKYGFKVKVLLERVLPINTTDYPLPAMRPVNSCLNTNKIKSHFGVVLPNWEYYVMRNVAEIISGLCKY